MDQSPAIPGTGLPPAAPAGEGSAGWSSLWASIAPAEAAAIAGVVRDRQEALVGAFYTTLLQHPEARHFLSARVVGERLGRALGQWLLRLFCDPAPDDATFAAEQERIGMAHARIRLPLHLVIQGAAILKAGIAQGLEQTDLPRGALCRAVVHVHAAIDLSIAAMSRSFVNDTAQGAQVEEAFRLFSLGQDITLERETQRAALMEWSQAVLFGLHSTPDSPLPAIGRSEFGLWLNHKAEFLFRGSPVLERLQGSLAGIDADLLPRLAAARGDGTGELGHDLEELQNRIAEIKYLLAEMFQGAAALESGRDPLTRALNRRFLPTLLGREVAAALRGGGTLSVLMIDVDHFKSVNDRFGHPGGDTVLQALAETILECCRSSDVVFRYGGEEFLVVLVETDAEAAMRVAERLRLQMAGRSIRLPDGQAARVTLSIGVATFDGHPDHARLITAADQALYRAKQGGRNRSVAA
ncbi:GGDEF domain-containing protein [Roseomonas sp. OT10]|uniref:GGDEF domain-containing protein n=1 Tax=Roseomonas cutis TaxID=2897332 RepID=UPI001E4D75BB|nr:GGDEF domain-containing protein [Roseomonas sp. OT10]UFN50549.1 GGDEF domain-containing protein [Roseomonas sp. OT10]